MSGTENLGIYMYILYPKSINCFIAKNMNVT